ncbi:DUF6804 family protein [Pseudomonas sp. C9-3]|uniref:DUF6804 family protein n=1 Tax=Pseudomonas sp. C9-3 TaxID=3078264 RepID=UPI0028E3B6F5|nr:DUF6804 family protein [Pseudomonas sp. C9-3]
MPFPVILLCSLMLMAGAFPLPYAYYSVLRLLACAVFIFAIYLAAQRQHRWLPWAYGLCALVFNPLAKLHLPKELWMLLDIAAGLLLLGSAGVIRRRASPHTE